jgi:hypothetical protein
MSIYAINAVMSSKCWYSEMMNHCARHAEQKIRQKRCRHSDFPWALSILHHQLVQGRPVRAAVPQIVRVVMHKKFYLIEL